MTSNGPTAKAYFVTWNTTSRAPRSLDSIKNYPMAIFEFKTRGATLQFTNFLGLDSLVPRSEPIVDLRLVIEIVQEGELRTYVSDGQYLCALEEERCRTVDQRFRDSFEALLKPLSK